MSVKSTQSKKIPTLRFPGFSDVWKEKKLGEILLIDRGASPRPISNFITKSSEGVAWIKIGDTVEGSKYIEKTEEKITKEGAKKSRIVNIGDFVLSNSMSFGRPYILKIDGCIHDGWLALKNTDKNNLSNDFLYEVLTSEKIRKTFLSLAAGSAVKNLKSETVKTAKVSIPNILEQQKISGFLGLTSNLIENLQSQKESFESYKKGMMQKLFSQEIRFKDTNGKEFQKWEDKVLGDCLGYEQPTKYIVKSTEYDNSYKTPVLTAGKTFILGYTNETSNIFKENLPVIIFDDFTTTSQFVDFSFKVKSSAMKILRAKKDINIGFIYEALNNIDYQVGGHGRHWISVYSKIKVSIPALEEQVKISDFLASIDKVIQSKQQQITQAESWKKGLIQELFV